MISGLLTNIGLICRIQFLLKGSFAKETCTFREPTNCSHPIYVVYEMSVMLTFARNSLLYVLYKMRIELTF